MTYNNLFEEEIKYLKRGTEEFISEGELIYKLEKSKETGCPLVIKEGVDPTSADIHLGHTVTLRKLKHFQNLGHYVKFLIGDFTARIGDPTGKSKARKPLTEEEVLKNAETYKEQIFKILDKDKTEIVYNSEWLKNLNLERVIDLLYRGTVNDLIKRKTFAKRLEEGDTVSATEIIYPFLQGYDSVAMKADVEIGGSDQYFNLVFGRDLQKSYGQAPQVVITMPLLVGTDGKEKMSKTLNNQIGINEVADGMYGKTMSIPDSIMINWFELLTDVNMEELKKIEEEMKFGKINPKEVKMKLARDIVSQYHGIEASIEAEKRFEYIHKHRNIPEDIKEILMGPNYLFEEGYSIIDILMTSGYCSSKNDARRKIEAGSVRINDELVTTSNYRTIPQDNQILKVGKRNFARIKYNK